MKLDEEKFLESCSKFTQTEIGDHLGMTQANAGRILRALPLLRLQVFLDLCVLLEEDPNMFLIADSE